MTGEELVLECDEAGTIRVARGALEHRLGYRAVDVVGRPIVEFMHPRNQVVAVPVIAALAGKPHLELWDEVRIRRADGSWAWFLASVRGGEPGGHPLTVSATPIPDVDADVLEAAHAIRDASAAAEQRFRLLADAAPIGVFQQSLEDGCVYVNRRWQEITGLARSEAMGDGWLSIIHPDHLDMALADHEHQSRLGTASLRTAFRIVRPDGIERWVKVGTAPVFDEAGNPTSIVGTMDDVTDQVAATERADRLTHVLEVTSDLVGMYDLAEDRVHLNASARRFFGLDGGEEGAVPLPDLWPKLPDWMVGNWGVAVGSHLEASGSWAGEIELRGADGSMVPWSALILARHDAAGAISGISGVLRDITDRKAMEARLEHQATHDPLTGLPNRVLLLDRLEVALGRAERTGSALAVLFVDLDRFKVVNDSLGHALGDRVLVSLADRIRQCVTTSQTVARFGGDEFVVLVEDLADVSDAVRLADDVAAVIARPVEVDPARLVVSASIGIALSAPGDTPEAMLRNADAAMYRAKAAGRSRAVVFEPSMHADAVDRFDVEAGLRRAVDADELVLHYQPKVDLATGRIVGLEALVRWQHPTRGLMLPDEFLPVAAETGLIVDVGAWVVEEALGSLAGFDAAHAGGDGDGGLYLCVNISAAELLDPGLPSVFESAIARHGVDASRVDVELTEHTLMGEVDLVNERLRALKAMGLQIAIDDFGTGYSSLAYLRRFPVDLLKIDRTFVEGLGERPEDAAIVRAIVTLADSLALKVVAEGVETAAQLAELRSIGCSMGQGYHFARPLPEAEVLALLASGPQW